MIVPRGSPGVRWSTRRPPDTLALCRQPLLVALAISAERKTAPGAPRDAAASTTWRNPRRPARLVGKGLGPWFGERRLRRGGGSGPLAEELPRGPLHVHQRCGTPLTGGRRRGSERRITKAAAAWESDHLVPRRSGSWPRSHCPRAWRPPLALALQPQSLPQDGSGQAYEGSPSRPEPVARSPG